MWPLGGAFFRERGECAVPAVSMLIKPASDACDLRCSYCFYADLAEKGGCPSGKRMSEETLTAIVQKGMAAAEGACRFAFQGGEPTLAGLDFFRRAVALQRAFSREGLRVENAIQTNGCSIDAEWAAFLAQERFLVGLSLDGTRASHDAFRRDSRGEGTFRRVLAAHKLLREAGAEVNILTVVTPAVARQADRVWDFYREQGFDYLQFIPCMAPLGQPAAGPQALTQKQYGDFLCRIFDRWHSDLRQGRYVNVRYFENLLGLAAGRPPEECGLCGRCANQLVVESDGSVYPCDFYVLPQWKLGKIGEDDLSDLLQSPRSGEFTAPLPLPPRCGGCRWRPLCGGGCRRERETAGGLGEYRWCAATRRFLEYAWPRLQKLVPYVRRDGR